MVVHTLRESATSRDQKQPTEGCTDREVTLYEAHSDVVDGGSHDGIDDGHLWGGRGTGWRRVREQQGRDQGPKGTSSCFSDATSHAVATNNSQAVAVDDSKANAHNGSSATAIGDCKANAHNGEDVTC
jgi:hypothetical protein